MLGTFACFCMEGRFGPDVGTGIQAAVRHYTRRLRSARKPVEVPRFLRDQPRDDARREFEVSIEPEIQELLEREAGEQHVYLDQVLSHAIFVYLADLDSARAGGGPAEEAASSTR